MRLIDADALIKTLKSNCKPELCHDYKNAWCEACCPYNNFEDLIDNAPTVTRDRPILGVVKADESIEFKEIKRDRPRGTWLIVNPNEPDYHKGVVKCTNCGQKFNYIDLCKIAPVKCFPDFCPNCGADIREDSDE